MKTLFEKMRSVDLYSFEDPEIMQSLLHAHRICAKLQTITIADDDYRTTM